MKTSTKCGKKKLLEDKLSNGTNVGRQWKRSDNLNAK